MLIFPETPPPFHVPASEKLLFWACTGACRLSPGVSTVCGAGPASPATLQHLSRVQGQSRAGHEARNSSAGSQQVGKEEPKIPTHLGTGRSVLPLQRQDGEGAWGASNLSPC